MKLTELEAAVVRDRYCEHHECTPEEVAERAGVTLGEIREAEKTALRKLHDPEHVDAAGLEALDLTGLEHTVLEARYCVRRARTPEALAEAHGVALAQVLEAEKTVLRKIDDPAHANRATLEALGLTDGSEAHGEH